MASLVSNYTTIGALLYPCETNNRLYRYQKLSTYIIPNSNMHTFLHNVEYWRLIHSLNVKQTFGYMYH